MNQNKFDYVLFLIVILLMGLGMVMIYSASSILAQQKFGDDLFFLKRQLFRIAVAILVMIFLMRFDYHKFQPYSRWLFLIAVLFCFWALLFGSSIKGAHRWVRMGFFSFQASDFAKIALIILVASLIVKKEEKIREFKNGLVPVLLMTGTIVFLISVQPDFGTAGTIAFVIGSMLWVGRAKIGQMILSILAVIPFLIGYVSTSSYRMERLKTFLGITDKNDSGYQIYQSLISLGNGGIFGIGLGKSKQKLLFLPEPYNDFIMAIIGEEWGFLLGTMVILILFLFLFWRGIRIARRAPDLFGFQLAIGYTVLITINSFINLGVVSQLLPTTGIPLPFISYGGSALVFNAVAIGILLNISSQGKFITKWDGDLKNV
jgi:cell division protein FtsW